MPHQNKLNVGDVIKIKKSKLPYLVVRSEHIRSMPYDGVPYRVDEIDVVALNEYTWRGMQRDDTVVFDDKKILSFYFEGGSMNGKGKCIKVEDILVVGTTKLKKEVTVTYTASKPKIYG